MRAIASIASSAGLAMILIALAIVSNIKILGVSGHVITAAATVPTYAYDDTGNLMAAGDWLGKRQDNYYTGTDCDGNGIWTCPTGTCYQGPGGFIGCCDDQVCNGRFICLPATISDDTCDPNLRGCLQCHSEAPNCIFENRAEHWIMYCDTASGTTISLTDTITSLPFMSSADSMRFREQGGVTLGASSFLFPNQWPFLDGLPAASTTPDGIAPVVPTNPAAAPSSITSPAGPTGIVTVFSTSTTYASSATGSAPTATDTSTPGSLSRGAEAGMAIGISIACVAFICGIAYCCLRRHRRNTKQIPAQYPPDSPLTHWNQPIRPVHPQPARPSPESFHLNELQSTRVSPMVSPVNSQGTFDRAGHNSRYSDVSALTSPLDHGRQPVPGSGSGPGSGVSSPATPSYYAFPPNANTRVHLAAPSAQTFGINPAYEPYREFTRNPHTANPSPEPSQNGSNTSINVSGQAITADSNNRTSVPSATSGPYLSAEDALGGGFWRLEAERRESGNGGGGGE
ncbi:hypothetical protein K490DRAFT_65143 [Saccharata proteae CBS 121410]|uniref:Uncharacterized protein n=1 Tax=Saccharata proteae CBS 121410 TaxID=1314787 RepID=A0A9P4HTQ9_9PEZI|nr:hypothetical protein K490DRAFT_65143 [Saccharata proteae CBS 121410]